MKKLTKAQQESRTWAEQRLKAMFEPILAKGEKPVVKTVLKHVSRSGMQREITLLFSHGGHIVNLNNLYCSLDPSSKCGKNDGIKIGGCGMDMGFALVYNLGVLLYGHDCGHVHGTRNGQPDKDGGYALRHEWA